MSSVTGAKLRRGHCSDQLALTAKLALVTQRLTSSHLRTFCSTIASQCTQIGNSTMPPGLSHHIYRMSMISSNIGLLVEIWRPILMITEGRQLQRNGRAAGGQEWSEISLVAERRLMISQRSPFIVDQR